MRTERSAGLRVRTSPSAGGVLAVAQPQALSWRVMACQVSVERLGGCEARLESDTETRGGDALRRTPAQMPHREFLILWVYGISSLVYVTRSRSRCTGLRGVWRPRPCSVPSGPPARPWGGEQ